MNDERLADVIEELPEEDQVEILEHLDAERAADVLEEMSPDDAADLIADLPPETAARLLELMESEDAEDVRRLMSYAEETAGGMMTSEPVILGPGRDRRRGARPRRATPTCRCRWPRWSTSAASPWRPPPAGCSACAHIQRLLREPPSTLAAVRHRHATRRAAARGHHRPGRGLPRDVQPGRGARGRRRGTAPGRGDRRRPARPHAPRELARPDRAHGPSAGAGMAESRRHRARHARRRTPSPLVRRPSYDADTFGVFAEQFARFMGTAQFLALHDLVRPRSGSPGTCWRPTTSSGTSTPSSS